jgi:autotransporter family porin
MQVKYHFYSSGWPEAVRSTAFNLDTAFAVWRACFEGYEKWLNDVTHVGHYTTGDLWGCVGRWYAGRWHTPDANNYIAKVKSFLAARVWENRKFQEP